MDIALTQRLSFKQAGLAVLVAFILGTTLSLFQVAIDYASEDASINQQINSLMEISRNPASRIAYNIDSELAQELVLGLLASPAVVHAQIVDNNNQVLGEARRAPSESPYRPISDFLFDAQRTFEVHLSVSHAPHENLGVMRLDIDTYAYGSHFLRRSLLTFLSGFARSLLLSLFLLVLFYFTLTKPLIRVIRAINNRRPNSSLAYQLEYPAGHERDEIGLLVNATNRQFAAIARETQQRQDAESRLTNYLNELENIVSARTLELKASNDRLLDTNRELELAQEATLRMSQARSAFMANMSHEIRTPLNGLLGMLALSLDGPLTNQQRQQLTIANRSGKVLVDLLNSVLDLSKFEAGQMELEAIPFDMATMIEDTASLLSQSAAVNVELTCLIDPNVPAQVIGDPTRVRQIISNLLSNALKFTRFGRVDVRLKRIGGGVQLTVRDTGIGIAEDAQARIFQPFMQAGADITRQFGGTGLGLALTHHLCKAMKGQLSLVSKPGFGSTFCAELPLLGHLPPEQPAPLKGKVLALTSKHSGLSDLLSSQLPAWGLEYTRLDTDASLLGLNPDLIISDCPECLYGMRPNTRTPILLVTAYGNFLGNDQIAALLPLEQLARPLSRKALYAGVQRTCSQTPTREALSTHRTNVAPGPRPQVLLVEDNLVNQLVAKGMLSKHGCDVIVAADGAQALQQLQKHPVDLVLMDCNMPVMDGYEATRLIRRNGMHPGLPIIALTANAMPDERERCQAAGMDDYLAKPIHREALEQLLNRWLRRDETLE
ncbi:MAG: hybrid sensor histidine kinase/response regulator [Pseudomonadaceae bacterium]|nr:hybrid sensor histidine kinase/response regulator [Pseudomonadaceae bacterium]